MKEKLNSIRKPIKEKKLKIITNYIGILLVGILLGVFSKWLDNLSIDNSIWWMNIIDVLDLRNVFSMFPIWLLFALIITVYSSSPGRASVGVFLFFLGMCAAYHLYTILFSGFNPLEYMKIWYLFTILSPVLAFVSWYSKSDKVISLVISTFILGFMFRNCFNIGYWYILFESIINTIIFAISVIVLHTKITNTIICVIASILLALLMNNVYLF